MHVHCEGCGIFIVEGWESPESDLCSGCYLDLAIGRRLYKLKCAVGWLLARLQPRLTHERLFDIRPEALGNTSESGRSWGGSRSGGPPSTRQLAKLALLAELKRDEQEDAPVT